VALTAADIANFVPAMVDPTAGAQAFSGSMRNIEAARANRAQEKQQKLQLREQQWQFDEQHRMQEEQRAAERDEQQHLAVQGFWNNVRSEQPAVINSAIEGLRATGLDARLEEDTPAKPAAPSDGLGPVSTPDEIANPAKYAAEPAPVTPAKSGRIVIMKNGQEIGSIPLTDLTEPGKDAMRKYQAMTSSAASGIPTTADPKTEDFQAALATAQGDPVKAQEIIQKQIDARQKAAESQLDREAGIQAAAASGGRATQALDGSSYERGVRIAEKHMRAAGTQKLLTAYGKMEETLQLVDKNPNNSVLYGRVLYDTAKAAQEIGVLTDQDVKMTTGARGVITEILTKADMFINGEVPIQEMQRLTSVLKQELGLWGKRLTRQYKNLSSVAARQPDRSMAQGYRDSLGIFETEAPHLFQSGGSQTRSKPSSSVAPPDGGDGGVDPKKPVSPAGKKVLDILRRGGQ